MRATAALLASILLFPGFAASQNSKDEAGQHYLHGRYGPAAELFRNQAAASPKDPELRLWLAKSYLRDGKVDESIEALEKAVDLDPKNGLYHLWLGRAYGEKAEHASIFTAFGWARKVRRAFETAVQLAPANMDARFDLLEFYLAAPGIVGGGEDKAELLAKEIAQASPRLGHTARSLVFRKQKKWDQALEELKQSAAKYADHADAHLDLAQYLLERGDSSGAEQAALQAKRIRPNLPRCRMVIAAAQIEAGTELAAAEKSLREIVAGPLSDDDPSFAEVHYWLGLALSKQGRSGEARASLQSALRFDPDHEKAKDALSRIR
jgi:tetratricopeptide (TPR) repeat protein